MTEQQATESQELRTRARKMSAVLKDAILGRPLPTRDLEPPILGASESCWLCHEHDDGQTVCHQIPCP